MIKLVKSKLSALATTALVFLSHGTAAFAQAAPAAPAANVTFTISPPPQAPQNVSVASIPQFMVTLLFIVGIIIAVVFLIYGGIKWILSGGDSKQVESARSHIVAAIVGLIIVVGAFIILNFVFTLLTGSGFDLTKNFCIPSLQNPNCK